MGYPSMGSGYGMGMMGSNYGMGTATPSAQTPVVHVYTKRRRLIEDGFYDGVGIRKCAVMEGVESVEICATFYFGQQVVALDYTVKSKMIQRVNGNELDHPDAVDEIEGEHAIADYDGDDYDILLDEHDEYEVSRIQRIFGIEVGGESLRDNATSNKVDEEIKLCVEMAEDDLNSGEIDAMQILIEFV